MIKPEFFDDPAVADLSPFARLFFIGLWLNADREGCIEDDIRRLKAKIFPYDDVDCEVLAVELHGKDMIRRYPAVERHGWIWIRNFTKHQRPHPREPKSLAPDFDKRGGLFDAKAVKLHGQPCKETAGTSESGEGIRNLEKVYGIPNPSAHNGNGSTPEPHDEHWATFQQAYPGAKRSAGFMEQQAFLAACADITFPALLAKLERHKQSKDWKAGFVPSMKKYLTDKLWIQEPEPPRDLMKRGQGAAPVPKGKFQTPDHEPL